MTTIIMDLDCSQGILDSMVKAIYAREIQIDSRNVEQILLSADYLQASLYTLLLLILCTKCLLSQNGPSAMIWKRVVLATHCTYCFSLIPERDAMTQTEEKKCF